MKEIWKQVPIEGCKYDVSNIGRVRHRGKKMPLNPAIGSKGYFYVYIGTFDGVQKKTTVHRLVALAFLGPYPEDCEVNHIDGDKLNNCVNNLEYITHLENARHAVMIGLHDPPTGSRNGMAKLVERDISTIRERLARGHSQASIARDYGVTRKTIWNIHWGKTWATRLERGYRNE